MSAPDPRPSEPAIQTAARLLAEGRPEEAAARLAALVAEAPTYAAAHVLRATALEAAGHVDDALVSWGRAAALVPRSPLVHRERERLLATHVAGEVPVDLPPPAPAEPTAPEPDVLEAAALEPADPEPDLGMFEVGETLSETPLLDEDEADDLPLPQEAEDEADDGPLLDFGAPRPPDAHPLVDAEAPQAFDASDLLFVDGPVAPPPPPAEAQPDPEPPASAPDPFEGAALHDADEPEGAEPPLSPLSPIAADWGADETDLAPVVPPEGDLTPLPPRAETPPDPVAGWDILSEADIPTPPPDPFAEPDIIAPEEREEPTEVSDPFGDIDAIIDEFGAPPSAEAPASDLSVADELDALIAQLEVAPRIRPDPEYRGPEVSLDAGDVDDMVSETLAKIYAAQHQYVEAALVYEKLAARQPEDAAALLERAAELRQRGA